MPAKKSRKTARKTESKSVKPDSKTSEKPVKLETYDAPINKDDNGLLSGLTKFLIFLAVVDFLVILGIIFILLAIKVLRFVF